MPLIPDDLRPVPNFDEQTCFGCGSANPQGLQMRFLTDDNNLYSRVTIPAVMNGWEDTVHGGIIATVLDEIMGWTAIYLLKKIVVTKSMTVEFIKPVKALQELTVIGSINAIHSERSASVTGAIYSADETLLARSTGEFSTMPSKTAVRLGVLSQAYMDKFSTLLGTEGGD